MTNDEVRRQKGLFESGADRRRTRLRLAAKHVHLLSSIFYLLSSILYPLSSILYPLSSTTLYPRPTRYACCALYRFSVICACPWWWLSCQGRMSRALAMLSPRSLSAGGITGRSDSLSCERVF